MSKNSQYPDKETRKQNRLVKLGTDKPICGVCGETDWRVFELHHVADHGRDEATVLLCFNCHRKVSDDQKDHLVFNPHADPFLDQVGRFLLGREHVYHLHALPPLWWEMPYSEFLVARRLRMAQVVRDAWQRLTGDLKAEPVKTASIAELIAGGETGVVEFKSTLRTNLHTGQPDEKMQLSALKTITGFLNAKGGTLLIGVSDNGEVLGLSADGFPNEDKMGLHLVNLIKDRIGDIFLPYIHPHFEEQEGVQVLAVRCELGPKAAFVKDGNQQRFFVRGGNATTELLGNSITDYVKQRYP